MIAPNLTPPTPRDEAEARTEMSDLLKRVAPPRSRDQLIEGVQGMVKKAVAEVRRIPPGLTFDDLVAEANVALCRRVGDWDPEKGEWTTFAGWVIKGAISAALAATQAQKRGGGVSPAALEAETCDGERLPMPADPRAADPAAIAEARELVAVAPPRGKGRLSVRALEAALPSPAQVADQVTALRAAMFGAIKTEDVEAVMGSVVAAAKGGDLKATKLLIDLLAPARSGVTTVVNQQAVVIRPEDVS